MSALKVRVAAEAESESWTEMVRDRRAVVMLAGTHVALAQGTGSTVAGVVHDEGGAAVSGANITAINTAINERRVQKSNEKGEYTLLDLRPGTYSLRVEAAAFRGYDQNGILLELNQHATQDISLSVRQVQQTVTVE